MTTSKGTSPHVKDLISKLRKFLRTDGPRNTWIKNKVMQAYVRKSKRLINNQGLSACLDLASLEIDEKHQGKGLGSDFIRLAHEENPYEFTYLENVLNDRFFIHLIGLGWATCPECDPPCLYNPAGRYNPAKSGSIWNRLGCRILPDTPP